MCLLAHLELLGERRDARNDGAIARRGFEGVCGGGAVGNRVKVLVQVICPGPQEGGGGERERDCEQERPGALDGRSGCW